MSALLEIDGLHCGYRGHPVVKGMSMGVAEGELACLLGASGCGKTTVLRAIAGFEPIAQGEIRLRGKSVSRPGLTVAPERRHLGMVFQDYALFPHLTIAANIGFGVPRLSSGDKGRRVDELLELMGLERMGERYPHELSGGQQQRVALARAVAPHPTMILMDEPFSNLDVDLRERVSGEVRDILKRQGITGILVTHDQHEAFALGDQIGVMNAGQILQWDTAYNLYHEPVDRFVADFIGQGVFLRGTVLAPNAVETELGIIRSKRRREWSSGSLVDVLLRPDDVVPDSGSALLGEVISKAFKGPETLYTLRVPTGSRILSMFPSHHDHTVGERVGIRVVADHLVAFSV